MLLSPVGCIPNDVVCDGVIDFVGLPGFHDEADCVQGMAHQCSGWHWWKCPGENTCLTRDHVCDTIPQCSNGEDEKHCDAFCDSIGGWRCQCDQLTQCYLPRDVCDGWGTCRMYTTRTHDVTDAGTCIDDEANCGTLFIERI
ncbi:LDL receptor repeat-containing protein egg-1-like [Branchiostoma floridae]|uniref:LDL receptor repeat-containing protein egg-1-like n=1 Tax=Branchiostoma floridae TaxID=7739 RepID=A0A9J7NC89_BRAFL|nr:LDL receptor repeat-containing protein egg-1-like [Branchiostoma floridae]